MDTTGSCGRDRCRTKQAASVNLPAAVASASYDADNRLTRWGSVTPTYDLNGNLSNDGSRSYTWDARNRLTAVTGTAGFAYDGFNRRQSKTIGATSTAFLYDRSNPIQELSSGTATANLLAGLIVDQVFTRTTSAGARHFLTDGLGSTIALTDGTGALQTQYTYEPYGNVTPSGAANDNSYQYTGRENDGTGLYYYRARYYNPVWQRFIAEDPSGLGGGTNLYVYAGGNPIMVTDSTGQDPKFSPAPMLETDVVVRRAFFRGDPFFHSSIWIVDNNTYSGGISTLGAQPVPSGNAMFGSATLISEPNNRNDITTLPNLSRVFPIKVPDGQSIDQFATNLRNAADAYSNSAPYGPIPFFWGGYNSNSYVSGVIQQGGGIPPDVPGYPLPGWSRPLPDFYFTPKP